MSISYMFEFSISFHPAHGIELKYVMGQIGPAVGNNNDDGDDIDFKYVYITIGIARTYSLFT